MLVDSAVATTFLTFGTQTTWHRGELNMRQTAKTTWRESIVSVILESEVKARVGLCFHACQKLHCRVVKGCCDTTLCFYVASNRSSNRNSETKTLESYNFCKVRHAKHRNASSWDLNDFLLRFQCSEKQNAFELWGNLSLKCDNALENMPDATRSIGSKAFSRFVVPSGQRQIIRGMYASPL